MTCGSAIRQVKSITSNELSKPREAIKDAISQRTASDKILPPWIVMIPFMISIMGGTVIFAVALSKAFEYFSENNEIVDDYDFIAGSEWILILALAISAIFYFSYGLITYQLIDRMNKHSAREISLRLSVSSYIETLTSSSAQGGRSELGWSWLGDQSFLSSDNVKRRSPTLWMVIIASPIIGSILQALLYFAYDYDTMSRYSLLVTAMLLIIGVFMLYLFNSLMKEIHEHDRRWIEFTRDVKVSLARAGFTAGTLPDHSLLEKRSFALYFVLSFVTMGLFMIYWWYIILKDPNDHFKKQWEFEDGLMEFISPR